VNQVTRMARDYFDGTGDLPEGWKAAGDYFAIVPMTTSTCATARPAARS